MSFRAVAGRTLACMQACEDVRRAMVDRLFEMVALFYTVLEIGDQFRIRSRALSSRRWDPRKDKGKRRISLEIRIFHLVLYHSALMNRRSDSAEARNANAAGDVDIGPFRINAGSSQGI